jgi:Holliday junction resolvase RusA-like endonuclease
LGSYGDLIDIITNKRGKKEMVSTIRKNFGEYFKNENFKKIREAGTLIDLAIFLEVDINNFKNQDLDNIQKVVLDALEKDEKDPSWNYLYENDSQVCRILVWKVPKKKIEVLNTKFNTVSMTISFRNYAPSKQMVMEGRWRY